MKRYSDREIVINLNRFNQKKEVILPIISNYSKYNGRILNFKNTEDGWYKVEISDTIALLKEASPLEIRIALNKLPQIKAYSFGDEMVPVHFNSVSFRYGTTESISTSFSKSPFWTVSKIRITESGFWVFDSIDTSCNINTLLQVRQKFEQNENIDSIKGVTPELRYYFILMRMQENRNKHLKELAALRLSEQERKTRELAYQATLAGRLSVTINDAGGHLHMFKRQGKDLIVIWSVGGQKFNSLIKADTLRVRELGYCASGEDKFHSMQSAVLLAQEYQKNNAVYIMRE